MNFPNTLPLARLLLPLTLLSSAIEAQSARVANFLPSPPATSSYGRTVVGLGDISVPADGMADFAVGDPFGPGLVEVRSGAAGNPRIWFATGTQAFEQFGHGLASVPDLNGDGVDDLAVGAPSFNGSATGEGRLTFFDATNGAVINTTTGGFANASLGAVLCRTNDLLGDGIDDLLVFRHQPGANEVLLLKGGDVSLAISMVIPGFSSGINDLVMSGAGDWDGDGQALEFALANPVLGDVRIMNVSTGFPNVLLHKSGSTGMGTSLAPIPDPSGGSALVIGDTNAPIGGIPFGALHLLLRSSGMSTLVPASTTNNAVGQSIAVVDIDLDGDMNILASANDVNLSAKVLVFSSKGVLQQEFVSPAGQVATALAVVGDQSGDGMAEFTLTSGQLPNNQAIEVLFGGNAATMNPAFRPGSTNSIPIPSLTLSAPPRLGSSVTLTMTGGLPQSTLGIIMYGTPVPNSTTPDPIRIFITNPLVIAMAGTNVNGQVTTTTTVPPNLALLGLPIGFQALDLVDPTFLAASNTISTVLGW